MLSRKLKVIVWKKKNLAEGSLKERWYIFYYWHFCVTWKWNHFLQISVFLLFHFGIFYFTYLCRVIDVVNILDLFHLFLCAICYMIKKLVILFWIKVDACKKKYFPSQYLLYPKICLLILEYVYVSCIQLWWIIDLIYLYLSVFLIYLQVMYVSVVMMNYCCAYH